MIGGAVIGTFLSSWPRGAAGLRMETAVWGVADTLNFLIDPILLPIQG